VLSVVSVLLVSMPSIPSRHLPNICQDLFHSILELVDKVLQDSKIDKSSKILLVLPVLSSWCPIILAIAYGAAQAAILRLLVVS
jgi:hypothetical protein